MNRFRNNRREKIERMVNESPAHRRGSLLENIGDAYLDTLQSDPNKRLAYLCCDAYDRALSYLQDEADSVQRARVLVKLQRGYLLLGMLDKPDEHWARALDIAQMVFQLVTTRDAADLHESYVLARLFQAEAYYHLALHHQRRDHAEQAIAAAKMVRGETRGSDDTRMREQSLAALLIIGRSYMALADQARTIEQVAHALDEAIQQLSPVRYLAPDGLEEQVVMVLLLLAEIYRHRARLDGHDQYLQAARRTLDVLDVIVPEQMVIVQGYAYYARSLIAEQLGDVPDTVAMARTAADCFSEGGMIIMALIARFRAFYLGLPVVLQVALFPAWALVHLLTNRTGDIL